MYPNPANNNNVLVAGGGIIANNLNAETENMEPAQQQQQQQQQQLQQNINYNEMQQQQRATNSGKNVRKKPYVKITEQPASKALRFRYECEGRSAGSIPGVNSTAENKTYPAIEIVGHKGRAVVVVSCVTKDQPYRPHPHNLVGKEGCKKGVCTLEINSETMKAVFSNLGIQCVKKKDIESALKAREEIRVDPFKTGFAHRFQPSSIDLNSVRLCFQVFMESDQKGRFTQPLPPVVSDPIYDKKAMSDLVICRLCSCSATVLGNTQIILLCEKVAKEDISVRFFEENNGQTLWEAFGEFQHTDVHKQTAIAFRTPRYRKIDITEPAKVFIQLKRPSDGVTSEALPFEYIPLDSDPAHLRRKRQKTNGDPMQLLLQQQQNQNQNDQDGHHANINCFNTANMSGIKTEPRDTSPQPYGMYRAPPELTPSPQPLSPTNAYTHNTPSPYNMAITGTSGTHGNQYNVANAAIGNNANSVAPPQLNINDYNAFDQQTQQQEQQLQYHVYNFGGAGATNWEAKFNPETIVDSGTGWNHIPNHFHPLQPQPQLQQQQQQQQQQYQQHLTSNNGLATLGLANTAVTAINDTNGNTVNNSDHGFSNLLTFDSGQLVRINSEDQQMLRLDSEDLQISNLSIST